MYTYGIERLCLNPYNTCYLNPPELFRILPDLEQLMFEGFQFNYMYHFQYILVNELHLKSSINVLCCNYIGAKAKATSLGMDN